MEGLMVRIPIFVYWLAWSAGVIAHRWQSALIPLELLCGALVVGGGLGLAIGWQGRARYWWCAVLFMLGLGWANLIASQVLVRALDEGLEKQNVVVIGTILTVPQTTARYTRFDFAVDSIEKDGIHYPSPGKIRLKTYHALDAFHVAQRWQLTVRLKKPHGRQNFGGHFNYETYLFEHRIRATGYVREAATNQLLAATEHRRPITQLRARMRTFIAHHFGDHPQYALLTALIVGIRQNLTAEQWRILQTTGTIHLVAISGLHIGLVAGAIAWFIAWLWRLSGRWQAHWPARKVALVVAIGAGLGYALLAGMTIPTRRAVLMLMVVGGAFLINRPISVWQVMSVALTVVLLADPLAVLGSGFWLSFAAVTVIVSYVQLWRARRPAPHYLARVGIYAGRWLALQAAIGFGMAPLVLLLYGQISLIAPLANLLAIPVVGGLAVPLGLLGLVLFVGQAETATLLAFQSALAVLDALWYSLAYLGDTPIAVWQPPWQPRGLLLAAAVGCVLLAMRSAAAVKSVAWLWFIPLLFHQPARLVHGEFRFTMLDVGHGLATVVETRHHTLIYDTGPSFLGGFNTGEAVVLPYLHARGLTAIDTAIISHEHNDHRGGFTAIAAQLPLARVLSGVPTSLPSVHSPVACHDGQQWQWDGVMFQVLWPRRASPAAHGNNASCVLKIIAPGGSVLLTGDIEAKVERHLVADARAARLDLASDFLQVPHQGSKTSSTVGFIAAVRPSVALLSSGYRNRFRHPHASVVARFAQAKIPLMSTAESGALTVTLRGEPHAPSINRYRDTLTGYWYHHSSVRRAILAVSPAVATQPPRHSRFNPPFNPPLSPFMP